MLPYRLRSAPYTCAGLLLVVAIVGCSPSTVNVTEVPGPGLDRRDSMVRNPSALPTVPLWIHKGKTYFGSDPVPAANRLLIPTRKGRLEYIDPNSGKRTGEAKAKYSLDIPPVTFHDFVFVVASSPRNRLQALDLRNGKRLWHRDFRVPLGRPIQVGEELWVLAGDSILAVEPASGHSLRAIAGGEDRWVAAVPGLGGFVLVGSRGSVNLVDSAGRQRWQAQVNGHCAEPPTLGNDQVYVCTGDGMAAALDSVGVEQWHRRLSDGYLYTPAVTDSAAYVMGRNGTVWALDRFTGDSLWVRSLGAPGSGRPLVRGNWLAAATVDGKLWFLDRHDGVVADSLVFDAIIHHPPVWAFGRLYVVTADKKLHAFGTGP